MSAHIAEDTEEITLEERLTKLEELRKRRFELSNKPPNGDTFYEWVELQTAYSDAGFMSNAAEIGRRVGDVTGSAEINFNLEKQSFHSLAKEEG